VSNTVGSTKLPSVIYALSLFLINVAPVCDVNVPPFI
jgi:hypothetical protein